MDETWREFLYPLGFLSSLAFASRFIVQWLYSEREGASVVPRSFWQLSLIGNTLLLCHAFFQMQYHVSLIQTANAIISWRNLNLMQAKTSSWTFRTVLLLLLSALISMTTAYILQGYILGVNTLYWFRIPDTPWTDPAQFAVHPYWHSVGFIGLNLFASRFWVQWFFAEKAGKSYLGSSFWVISLFGDLLCLSYFFIIRDPVNLIGPLFGLVPYLRNLILIKKQQKTIAYEQ